MNPRAIRILLLVGTLFLLSAAAVFAGESKDCKGWCVDLVDSTTGEPRGVRTPSCSRRMLHWNRNVNQFYRGV